MSLGLVADRWGMEGGVVGWVEQSNKHHWICECFHGYPVVDHQLGACYIDRDRHASQKKYLAFMGGLGWFVMGEMRDIHKYQKCQQKSADSQLPVVGAPCASMQVVTADLQLGWV